MASAFTPGPWEWHNGHLVSDLDGQYILMPRPQRGAENPIPINVIRDEDAALIAAAPELYEALQDIAEGNNVPDDLLALDVHTFRSEWIALIQKRARAAIAKATGAHSREGAYDN